MSKLFNINELENYEFYHLKYGKGAVIIAIEKEDCAETESDWNMREDELFEEYQNKIRPLKKEITKLDNQLRQLRSGVRKKNQQPTDEEISIASKIELLEHEIKTLRYVKKKYYTNMQIAMFYAQSISSHNDSYIRIDKVVNIKETDTHLIVLLKFDDVLQEHNRYHQLIMSSNSGHQVNDRGHSNRISGLVKRVLPITSVTLEIVSRVDQETKP